MKSSGNITATLTQALKTSYKRDEVNGTGQEDPKAVLKNGIITRPDLVIAYKTANNFKKTERTALLNGPTRPKMTPTAPTKPNLADLRNEKNVRCAVILRKLGKDAISSKSSIERLANESFVRQMPYFLAQRTKLFNGAHVKEPVYADAAELVRSMAGSLTFNNPPGLKVIAWQDAQDNFIIFCLPSLSDVPVELGSNKFLSSAKMGDYFLSRILTIGEKKSSQDRIMSLILLKTLVDCSAIPKIPISNIETFLATQSKSKILEEQVNILTLACCEDDNIMIGELLRSGVPAHVPSASAGVFPITYAAVNGCKKNIETLLAHGAKFGEDLDYLLEREMNDDNREILSLAILASRKEAGTQR